MAGLDHPSLLPAALTGDRDRRQGARVPRSARDWIVDATCFLLALAFGAGAFIATVIAAGPAPRWLADLDPVAGLVACAALWLRRRWPLGVALAILPLAAFSAAASGAQLVAMFTVAVHRRLPVAAATAGLYAAATVVTWAVHEPRPGADWGAAVGPLLAGALVNASVLAWGMFVRARRQLVLSLAERARRAEAEQQARAQEARRLERERIAREMHDVLAHRISLLSLHAGALEFHPDAPAEEVARAAGVIRQSAHQALQDLRRVISVLRWPADGAAPPPPQPTLADLPALVDDSRQAGTRVRLDSRLDDLEAAPADLGRDAYRVVQEALTNARKHAPACAVWLVVEGGPGAGLTVEARNRLPLGGAAGPVAPLVPGAGLGLVGLTERGELAGGRLEHGPTADGHFRLRAWLPWPA